MTHNEHYWHHYDAEIDLADDHFKREQEAIENERFRELCSLSDEQIEEQYRLEERAKYVKQVYALANAVCCDLIFPLRGFNEEYLTLPPTQDFKDLKIHLINFKKKITKDRVQYKKLCAETNTLEELDELRSRTSLPKGRDKIYYENVARLALDNEKIKYTNPEQYQKFPSLSKKSQEAMDFLCLAQNMQKTQAQSLTMKIGG